MAGIGAVALIALIAGILRRDLQPFVFIVVIVLSVAISWLWSVAIDRILHKLRMWNKSQAPKPINLEARTAPAVKKRPLRVIAAGPASLSVFNLISTGGIPRVITSAESPDPAERILSLKLQAAKNLRDLAAEMEADGRAEAGEVWAQVRRLDPADETAAAKAPGKPHELAQDELSSALVIAQSGDCSEALPALEAVVGKRYSGAAAYALALCYAAGGQLDKAADTLNRAAEHGAESAELRLALGVIYAEQGNYDKALKQLRASVTMDADIAMSHAALGSILLRMGNQTEAREAVDNALSLDSELLVARATLAMILYDKGDYAGAAREFSRITNAETSTTDAAYNQAAALFSNKKPEDVIKLITPLFDSTSDAGLAQLLGEAHEAKGNMTLARQYFGQTESQNGESSSARLRVIRSLRVEGNLEEARDEAEAAVRESPKSAEALTEFGLTLEAMGKEEEALNHYRTANQIDRSSTLAVTELGRLLYQTNRLKEAMGYLKQATAASDASADAHYWLGESYLRSGKPLLAIDALREAVRLSGNKRGEITYAFGTALLEAGRPQDAAEEFRRARKMVDEPTIDRDLGYALHRTRNYQEAIKSLRAYLDEAPEASDADDVRSLVERISTT